MYYMLHHTTRYEFAEPITENAIELRVHPRSDGRQRCLSFDLTVEPNARVFQYRDFLGNHVHHFDVPGAHEECLVVSEALVEILDQPELPDRLTDDAWGQLAEAREIGDYTEMLLPSRYARPSALLAELLEESGVRSGKGDPLAAIRSLNEFVHRTFTFASQSTRVDSPIDEALATRAGVCQDFAQILIALLRAIDVPARYVSGYVHHREIDGVVWVDDATHAWCEALLPGLGWVGFDPTTGSVCGRRYIRTAIGRDYADVPPTKGVYRGDCRSELNVHVGVWPWGLGLYPPQPVLPRRRMARQNRDDERQSPSTDAGTSSLRKSQGSSTPS